MPWIEPLSVSSVVGIDTVTVTCQDGARQKVASGSYKFWLDTSCSGLGPLMLHSKDASPRQQARALALIVRECVRSARAMGIKRYFAEGEPQMETFARLVAGSSRRINDQGQTLTDGLIEDLWTAVQARQAADGKLTLARVQDEQAIADTIPARALGNL